MLQTTFFVFVFVFFKPYSYVVHLFTLFIHSYYFWLKCALREIFLFKAQERYCWRQVTDFILSTFGNKNRLKTCVKLKINSNVLQQHKKITVNSQNVFRFSLLPSSILVLDFGAKLHTILVVNVSFRVSKFLYLFKFYLWIHFLLQSSPNYYIRVCGWNILEYNLHVQVLMGTLK